MDAQSLRLKLGGDCSVQVEWTEAALADLEDIHSFIALDSPENARTFISTLIDIGDSLSDFPQRGRPVPEALNPASPIRELIHHGYRLIYWVNGTTPQVLAVIHGARNIAHLAQKPWE